MITMHKGTEHQKKKTKGFSTICCHTGSVYIYCVSVHLGRVILKQLPYNPQSLPFSSRYGGVW